MRDENCVSVRGAEGFAKGTAEGCVFRDGFLRLEPGVREGSFTTEWFDCAGLKHLVLWWNGLTPGKTSLVPRARILAGGRTSCWMRAIACKVTMHLIIIVMSIRRESTCSHS